MKTSTIDELKKKGGHFYLIWRKKVIKRDKNTCQKCGKQQDKHLEAHHIKSWFDYPDLRFKLDNGITLCGKCHFNISKNNFKDIGKKPHKFTFTYQDLSLLTGLGVPTLRKYRTQSKFDPSNLESVFKFVTQRLGLK